MKDSVGGKAVIGGVGIDIQNFPVQDGVHLRRGSGHMEKIGEFLPHDGVFLDYIIPLLDIVNLLMQGSLDNDFIRDYFIVQIDYFRMDIDYFANYGRQCHITRDIDLR